MSKAQKQAPKDIVVSSIKARPSVSSAWRWLNSHSKAVFLISGGILVALVIATAIVTSMIPDAAPAKAEDPVLPHDYGVMSPEQVALKLKIDTGLDVKKLQNETITAKTFKNFNSAYESGEALLQLNAGSKALQAFQIALEKKDSTTNYNFYVDYRYAAAAYGDSTLAAKLNQQAITALQNDKSIDSDSKQVMLGKLNNWHAPVKTGN